MARIAEPSDYEKMLSILEGVAFEDEVCSRLAGLIADFQRIPPKPSGDGGLDGLSHGQTCAYCCYGPEQKPMKVATKGLKNDIVEKFRGDLRKLFELAIGPGNRLITARTPELETIMGDGNRVTTIYLIVSWFESHRIIGPLNTALAKYKEASKLRFVHPEATSTIWGPRDLATRGALDEHTLFRIQNRTLIERVRAAGASEELPVSSGDFDAKFDDLRRLRPDLVPQIDGLADHFRRAWAAAIALDNELASTSVVLHEALEDARTQSATSARLRSMGTTSPHELIGGMRQEVTDRLGQSFGQRLGSLTSRVADGEVGRLIGECPLEWRSHSE